MSAVPTYSKVSVPPASSTNIKLVQALAVADAIDQPQSLLSDLHRYNAIVPVSPSGLEFAVLIDTGSSDLMLPNRQELNQTGIGLLKSDAKRFRNGSVPCSDRFGNTGGAQQSTNGVLVDVDFELGGEEHSAQVCSVGDTLDFVSRDEAHRSYRIDVDSDRQPKAYLVSDHATAPSMRISLALLLLALLMHSDGTPLVGLLSEYNEAPC